MLTLQALKQDLRKYYGIKEITISIGEYDGEYDVNVNVWAYNRYFIEEFECFTRNTYLNKEKAMKLAIRTELSLKLLYGNKVKYVGLENC